MTSGSNPEQDQPDHATNIAVGVALVLFIILFALLLANV